MHNKLRRLIVSEQQAQYDTPVQKIVAQSILLDRALAALGGPVEAERTPEVTVASIPVVTSEKMSEGMVALVNPDDEVAVIICDDGTVIAAPTT